MWLSISNIRLNVYIYLPNDSEELTYYQENYKNIKDYKYMNHRFDRNFD